MDIRGVNDSGRGTVGLETKNTGEQGSKDDKLIQTVSPNVSEKRYSKKELEKEVDSLNEFLKGSSTHLKFQLHEKLGEYYVQVVNDHSEEVIREIPSKKMLDMVAQMYEMVGILVDEKR
ncbi:flagellar protein FlaG [Brevibacillus panacihumi W25]|uniref:Flagellar protein FlaG n=1 Tax=Brevibacillus panacihumi W25 TaxID=1408254 RepID=V6MA10_9BACL|nr:flagellar protein FlaG [Brevibacillus panacihumi]EST55411.1 flagellar protein FlaG [Brevibacillus panacihumi W25]